MAQLKFGILVASIYKEGNLYEHYNRIISVQACMITLLLILQFLKCTTHYITVKILNITIATHPIAKDVAIVTNRNHVKASSTDMQHTCETCVCICALISSQLTVLYHST